MLSLDQTRGKGQREAMGREEEGKEMEHWDRKVSQLPTKRSKNMGKQLIQTFLVSMISRICKMLIKGTLCLESRRISHSSDSVRGCMDRGGIKGLKYSRQLLLQQDFGLI
jgi:hypothetical protein